MRSVLQQCQTHRISSAALRQSTQTRQKHYWQDNRTKFESLPEAETRREEHKTYRVRKHGNRELPLPPMLDPAVHKQFMKYTKLDQQKWARDVRKIRFRRELFSNPWAAALATPVRHCQWTGARLPRHFLQRMRVYFDEGARKARWRPCREEDGRDEEEHEVVDEDGIEVSQEIEDLSGTSTYMASHAEVLKAMNRRKGWTKLVNRTLAQHVADKFNMNPQSSSLSDKFEWDKSIESIVVKEMAMTVQREWQKLLLREPELVLKEATITELEKVEAYVQEADMVMPVSVHNGKPLYQLPLSSTTSERTTQDMKAIIKHHDSIPYMLALDRLFSFLEAYPSQHAASIAATDTLKPP